MSEGKRGPGRKRRIGWSDGEGTKEWSVPLETSQIIGRT